MILNSGKIIVWSSNAIILWWGIITARKTVLKSYSMRKLLQRLNDTFPRVPTHKCRHCWGSLFPINDQHKLSLMQNSFNKKGGLIFNTGHQCFFFFLWNLNFPLPSIVKWVNAKVLLSFSIFVLPNGSHASNVVFKFTPSFKASSTLPLILPLQHMLGTQ